MILRAFALGGLLALAACRPTPASTVAEAPKASTDEPVVRVHLVDVGQGAATLVELPCGAVLIDTGGETNHLFDSGKALVDYLEAFFARRPELHRTLDLVVLSHPHLDHTRNAELVASRFTVKNVVTDGQARGSGGKQQAWLEAWAREHARLEVVASRDVPPGGKTGPVIDPVACAPIDPKISVLWGGLDTRPPEWAERAFHNHNNHSVVLRVELGRATFLFNGDLEEAGIGAVLERHGATGALDVDVWQVGHHGSYNATTAPLLAALSPRIALIPMGAPDRWANWTAWKFGHPRKKAVELLRGAVGDARPPVDVLVGVGTETFEVQRLERAVYGTGWDGTVVVTGTADGRYTVATSHPPRATTGLVGPASGIVGRSPEEPPAGDEAHGE